MILPKTVYHDDHSHFIIVEKSNLKIMQRRTYVHHQFSVMMDESNIKKYTFSALRSSRSPQTMALGRDCGKRCHIFTLIVPTSILIWSD
jgi:hypothetical protein